MSDIKAVSSPRWVRNGTAIDLVIEHEKLGIIPFTAAPYDTEDYGRALYEMAVNGEFGEIAAEIERTGE
jgi:hypothetical protein